MVLVKKLATGLVAWFILRIFHVDFDLGLDPSHVEEMIIMMCNVTLVIKRDVSLWRRLQGQNNYGVNGGLANGIPPYH